jgi:hypothetical protein
VTPDTASHCRDVLDRLRAQVNAHLPPARADYNGHLVSESVVPLDRLPMIGQVVQQLIESEAVFASAQQPEQPNDAAQPTE